MRRYFGRQHPFTLKAIHRLIRVYQLQGRHAQAASSRRVAGTAAEGLDDHPVVSTILHLLGRNLLEEKKYAEAERHLPECLQGLVQERSGRLTRGGSPCSSRASWARAYSASGSTPRPSLSCSPATRGRGSHRTRAIPKPSQRGAARDRGPRADRAALRRLGQPGRAEVWRNELAARAESADEGRPYRLGLHGGAPVDDRAGRW